MADAILELRAVVKKGTPDQISAAIETFKARALAVRTGLLLIDGEGPLLKFAEARRLLYPEWPFTIISNLTTDLEEG